MHICSMLNSVHVQYVVFKLMFTTFNIIIISIVSLQTNIALVYSESIEKLKGVLLAMQNASQKREKLEKQLREQLQSEISQLKGGGGGRNNSKLTKEKPSSVAELQQQILLLEADVAKVCFVTSEEYCLRTHAIITVS